MKRSWGEIEHIRSEKPSWCAPRALNIIYNRYGLVVPQTVLASEMGTTLEQGTPIHKIKEDLHKRRFSFKEYEPGSWDKLAFNYLLGNPILIDWWDDRSSDSELDDNGHYSVVERVTGKSIKLVGEGELDWRFFSSRWHDWDEINETRNYHNRWMLAIQKKRR